MAAPLDPVALLAELVGWGATRDGVVRSPQVLSVRPSRPAVSVPGFIIEHVIETRELDRPETLAGAQACFGAVMRAQADLLGVAAHWADLHDPDSLPPVETTFEKRRRRLDLLYGVQPGGEGTPEVLAHCFAELGLVLQTSAGGAKHLVADALDLRHRLPRLWREVQDGRVRAWQARKVAQATRHLPLAAMDEVDPGLAGLMSALPWSRFEAVLDATVMRADPAGAAYAEAEASSRRFVVLGRDAGRGLKTLIARGEVLDILTFLAAVNRIADCLAADGDDDGVEVRRSKAVGILGQPDRALALLTAHAGDADQPAPAVEPRERDGWRRPARHEREHQHDAETESDNEPEPVEEPEPEPRSLSLSKGGEAEPDEQPEPDPRSLSLSKGEAESDEEPEPEPESDEPGSRSLDLTGGGRGRDGVGSIRVQLYVHLTEAALNATDPAEVCRVEGVGPVTARTVREWLGKPDVRITVRPVAVPGEATPVDGYEIPHSVRESVLLRNPASAFPWSWCTDRRALQLDHVRPYLAMTRGGPPGQTAPRSMAPLLGTEHQRKTSRSWSERSPAPGVYLWRSPHGWVTLVTNQGTFPLGREATAQAMWRAAAPVDAVVRAA